MYKQISWSYQSFQLLAYRATGATRACSAAARQGKARLGAPVMQDRAVKWAVRVVLEVGRRSGGLLPDDSGADEAALAAQGVEVAHGVWVSNLDGLTEELVQVLVGVDVAASGHLEGNRLALEGNRATVEWAVRVVLEVGRRSSGLLPDDSGADEAALAA